MRIEKSVCGGFVRITICGVQHVVTIGEWAKSISRPTEFLVTPAEKLKAQGAN